MCQIVATGGPAVPIRVMPDRAVAFPHGGVPVATPTARRGLVAVVPDARGCAAGV